MHLTNTTIIKLKQHIISPIGPCDGFEIHAMQRVTGREFASYFSEEGFSLTSDRFSPRLQKRKWWLFHRHILRWSCAKSTINQKT
jgi:hypothetical protein